MRYVLTLLLGGAMALFGWWMVAHWGACPWWSWLSIGFVSGLLIGGFVMRWAFNVAYQNSILRALGWR
jgi:hypothetical protein